MPSPGGLQALNSLMDIFCPWTKELFVSKESLIITELIELFCNLPIVFFSLYFLFFACWLHLYMCLLPNHMKSTDVFRGWLFSPAQKSPYIFGRALYVHVTLTHYSSMKSSERAANSPNFPWIRSWHFNERKDNVWNKASSGFLPSMCHSNSTSCPSTQQFILFRPPKSSLNTFSDSWGLSCQHVFPASGTQWLWTGPRKFFRACLFCFVIFMNGFHRGLWLQHNPIQPFIKSRGKILYFAQLEIVSDTDQGFQEF